MYKLTANIINSLFRRTEKVDVPVVEVSLLNQHPKLRQAIIYLIIDQDVVDETTSEDQVLANVELKLKEKYDLETLWTCEKYLDSLNEEDTIKFTLDESKEDEEITSAPEKQKTNEVLDFVTDMFIR